MILSRVCQTSMKKVPIPTRFKYQIIKVHKRYATFGVASDSILQHLKQ